MVNGHLLTKGQFSRPRKAKAETPMIMAETRITTNGYLIRPARFNNKIIPAVIRKEIEIIWKALFLLGRIDNQETKG